LRECFGGGAWQLAEIVVQPLEARIPETAIALRPVRDLFELPGK
jgi:hypothetical protein